MRKMPRKTALNSVEQYELNQWLQQNNINPAKLRRSFTDVMPLARLLSRYYPELVDVNYYPPRNSIQSKLSNWQLFSKRVLSKMGVRVTREEMDRVARCVPGSIDILLFSILCAHNAAMERRKQMERDSDTGNNNNNNDDDEDDDDDDDDDNDIDNDNDDDNVDDDDDLPDEDIKSNDASDKIHEPQIVVGNHGNLQGIRSTNASNNAMIQSSKHSTQITVSPNYSNLRTGQAKSTPSLVPSDIANVTGHDSSNGNVKYRKGVASVQQRTNSMLSRNKPIVEDKDVVMVNVRKQIGDLVCELPQKMVLYSVYAQAADNLQQKSVNIARYLQRNAHLESMLQLKVERIDELQQRINILLNDESTMLKRRPTSQSLIQPNGSQNAISSLNQANKMVNTNMERSITHNKESRKPENSKNQLGHTRVI